MTLFSIKNNEIDILMKNLEKKTREIIEEKHEEMFEQEKIFKQAFQEHQYPNFPFNL